MHVFVKLRVTNNQHGIVITLILLYFTFTYFGHHGRLVILLLWHHQYWQQVTVCLSDQNPLTVNFNYHRLTDHHFRWHWSVMLALCLWGKRLEMLIYSVPFSRTFVKTGINYCFYFTKMWYPLYCSPLTLIVCTVSCVFQINQ